jgi:hypothetical protein|uniref:Uncharacterized protein n=1 Tax=Siphoviridae sp. ctRGj11 TaxID=2827868 RepID=A0A8S5SKV8_9CAUD|nr:MAG TPA: hypothetical protein [Siphoviridae sp. ctRGj11]
MNTTSRIDTFVSILREACKAGQPTGYASDTPADKLITLTGNVSDLCWEIAATAKQVDPSNKIITADSIKYNAANIINTCTTELENLGYATENVIELIATDGALWFWNLNQYPLNKLDQDVDPVDRIQSLNVAMGYLLEWWPNKITHQIVGDLNSELERHFINLAYEAACAIIAHTH